MTLIYTPLSWLFEISSNPSVRNIVVDLTQRITAEVSHLSEIAGWNLQRNIQWTL